MQDNGYYVWNPDERAPRHKHASRELAIAESERLARNNPGQTFVVLHAIGSSTLLPPRLFTPSRDVRIHDDPEVPF